MLNHPTQDLMQSLGFEGMAKGFKELQNDPESQALDHQEWLGLLLGYEATSRQQKRFERRLRAARLGQAASVEDVDYRASRGLDRGLFQKLATNDWIHDRRNLLITGPCGIGKSYLACALGHKACRDDLSVVYHRAPRLFAALALARGDGRYARVLRSIARTRLLIIDDWGPEPLNADQRCDLLEIVEDRYDAGSILITSQLPIESWHDIIGDPTIADTILYRIVRNAYRIELSGESRAKPAARTAGLDQKTTPIDDHHDPRKRSPDCPASNRNRVRLHDWKHRPASSESAGKTGTAYPLL